jgi:hypothetical protein
MRKGKRARVHEFTDTAPQTMPKPNMEIRGCDTARREILRSLTKKQESFSTVPAHRMKALETKAFAFFIVMRSAMPYDGLRKCGGRAPPLRDKIPFHAIH